jgi:curved DNA-binding protein CbpA
VGPSEHEIVALARELDGLDYYRLLRVAPGARAPQIRDAYHAMRRAFHPDAFVSAPPQVRNAVDRIARRVSEAYVVLRHPARRQAYDRGLERGALRFSSEEQKDARKKSETPLGATPQGRRLLVQAQDAERRGDLKQAISHLKLAVGFEPSNTHFKARIEELEKLYQLQKLEKKSKAGPF